jgi:hypothetical protein
MSQSYAEERYNEPDDEYEYDDENVEPRQRISPAGLWWIIGGRCCRSS